VGVIIAFPLFAVAIGYWREAYHLSANSGNYRINFGRFLKHI
jgi:hypothetical protein